MSPLAPRDAIRLAESVYSGNLWRRQLNGEKIFNSDYSPLERIQHYNDRNRKYGEYLAKHLAKGTAWEDILNVINAFFQFIPEPIREQALDYILTTLKEFIFGLFEGDKK